MDTMLSIDTVIELVKFTALSVVGFGLGFSALVMYLIGWCTVTLLLIGIGVMIVATVIMTMLVCYLGAMKGRSR